MINLIKAAISTLNDVEVKGRDNLDKLLGVINALETVADVMESEHEEKNNKEAANG